VLRTIRGAGAEDRVLRLDRADDRVARLVLPPKRERSSKEPFGSLSMRYSYRVSLRVGSPPARRRAPTPSVTAMVRRPDGATVPADAVLLAVVECL
jgi:hypothetical protein